MSITLDPQTMAVPTQLRADTTAQRIKALILHSRLHPGDPLPTETELCRALAVSRSSVREAIRRLVTLDIVDVRHGQGTFVGNLSLAPLVEGLVFRGTLSPGDELGALREVVEVRMALDLALADSLAGVMSGRPDPRLESLVATMKQKATRGERSLDEDREFHAILASKLGNQLFEQLVTAFWEVHSVVAPRLGLSDQASLMETAQAHEDIVRAAAAGDSKALRTAISAHYAPIQAALKKEAINTSGATAPNHA